MKALAKHRSDALQAVLDKVAMDDAMVCQDAARALTLTPKELLEMRDFDDAQLAQRGWTRRAFEAAWEGRKPLSEASVAVKMAHERTGMRIRQTVDRQASPSVAVVIMGAPSRVTEEQRRNAPVIDVGEK